MTEDENFAVYIRKLARELDPPPQTPREEIWARIEQARRFRRPAPSPRRAVRIAPWLRWAAPLAATLVIGIGIGRFWQPGPESPVSPVGLREDGPAAPESNLPYRFAAMQHLDAAEALLAALPEDARRGRATQVASWAHDLLLTTRLLLDSPAAEDPQMAALFQDLELVLAQIAALSAPLPDDEIELIEEGIRQNDVLLRVRTATNQRFTSGI